jgi:hypothetical protein
MFPKQALLALLAAAVSLSASAAPAEKAVGGIDPSLLTPAPRIDSGLGEVPPFETWNDPWVYATPAETRDNGLGELAPYSEWQYTWVYAMPAEKIDSGLGEIRPMTVSETPLPPERRIQ